MPEAAAWLGVVPAACVLIGLRSGSRGGPLALDAADVRVALGAPVSTGRRPPVTRPCTRPASCCSRSVLVGAAAGDLAGRRLGGNRAEWIACGALALATSTLAGFGTACLASGRRLRPSIATAAGVLLVAWALADAADGVWSPFRLVGVIALWPLGWDPVGLAPPVVAAVLFVAGVAALGGISLERLERRSRLVGQIRFAATLQDLRTVIVLRRQLTQERARTIPWLRPRLRRASVRLPVMVRDVRSVLRWPGQPAGPPRRGRRRRRGRRSAWPSTAPRRCSSPPAAPCSSAPSTSPSRSARRSTTRAAATPCRCPSG